MIDMPPTDKTCIYSMLKFVAKEADKCNQGDWYVISKMLGKDNSRGSNF